jgi:hypothetical protein
MKLVLYPFFVFITIICFCNGFVICFLFYFDLYPLYNPISTIRDTLLACFPRIHHLMCYFHVKQACQVKLRGKPMHEQKEILRNIDELHSTISPSEYNDLYRVTYRKWCDQCSAFAYYFEQQWNSVTAFHQWKVFCCPPGVATMNNSLESFNAMFKKSYTNHTRHTMTALYDIIHDRLLVDLSKEIIHGHKLFHITRKPDRAMFVKANAICSDKYRSGMSMQLVNKQTRASYYINVGSSTCTCKYYYNKGYCKHIVFSLNHCNIDSAIIEVKQIFRYKGNTQRTKRMHCQFYKGIDSNDTYLVTLIRI